MYEVDKMNKFDELMQTLENKVNELSKFNCLKTKCLKFAVNQHETTYNEDG